MKVVTVPSICREGGGDTGREVGRDSLPVLYLAARCVERRRDQANVVWVPAAPVTAPLSMQPPGRATVMPPLSSVSVAVTMTLKYGTSPMMVTT